MFMGLPSNWTLLKRCYQKQPSIVYSWCICSIRCSLYELLKVICFGLVELIKWSFVKQLWCHVWTIFEIWIILNMIKISWILVYLHWYFDSPYAHAKGINSNIHSIISCHQTISLPNFWHVGKSMCLWQNTKCLHKNQIIEGNQ
jgi:hypothetical protein